MAENKWISFSPVKGGKAGETTKTEVQITATEYTGRIDRSDEIEAKATGNATAKINVTQRGLQEHITLNGIVAGEVNVSCEAYDASKDTSINDRVVKCQISGQSNCSTIKLASTDTVISGVTAKLKIQHEGLSDDEYHEVTTWDGKTNNSVSCLDLADPGANRVYNFIIEFTVPENKTLDERYHKLKLTNAGVVNSADITITQAAGEYTYGNIVITSNATYADIPAKGGSVNPTAIKYAQEYGWNGRATGAGSISNEGATITYKDKGTDEDIPNGIVSAASRGIVIGPKVKVQEVVVTIALHEKTVDSEPISVYQSENAVIGVVAIPSKSKDGDKTIAANGAKISLLPAGDNKFQLTFSSTATDEVVDASAYGTVAITETYASSDSAVAVTGTDASAADLATTIKARVKLATISHSINGTFTPKAGNPGEIITIAKATENAYCDVYQAENIITSIALLNQAISYAQNIPASGQTGVLPTVSTPIVAYTYTSGATQNTSTPDSTYGSFAEPAVTYEYEVGSADKNGFNLADLTTGAFNVASRTNVIGDAWESGVVVATWSGARWVPAAGFGSSVSAMPVTASAKAKQVANERIYGEITITNAPDAEDIPASGGSVASISDFKAEEAISYTSGTEETWTTDAGVEVTNKLVINWGAAVTADTLNRTIRVRTKVGDLTVKVANSINTEKFITGSYPVYQAENKIISYSKIIIPDYDSAAKRSVELSSTGESYELKTSNIHQLRTYSTGVQDDFSKGEAITIAAAETTSAANTDKLSVPITITTAVKEGTAKAGWSLTNDSVIGGAYTTVVVEMNPGTSLRDGFVIVLTANGNTVAGQDANANDTTVEINFKQTGEESKIYFDATSDNPTPNTCFIEFGANASAAGGLTTKINIHSNDTWSITGFEESI